LLIVSDIYADDAALKLRRNQLCAKVRRQLVNVGAGGSLNSETPLRATANK